MNKANPNTDTCPVGSELGQEVERWDWVTIEREPRALPEGGGTSVGASQLNRNSLVRAGHACAKAWMVQGAGWNMVSGPGVPSSEQQNSSGPQRI